jgi:mannose-6-phosphate isomerase
MNKSAILQNTIQEYAWGSLTAIPQLLGNANPENVPQAELWMGAHPKAPSKVFHNNQWVSLLDLINENPEAILGKTAARKFNGTLPYLFKVLAASRPLSIQAHPNLEQARRGFQRENAEGIPLSAPHRNYKDANHKPECILALTLFWALCGFRNPLESITYFTQICPNSLSEELAALRQAQASDGLRRFFSFLMNLDDNQRKSIISEARHNLDAIPDEDPVFGRVRQLANEYPDDIGIFAPIFLNLVCLKPGQAMFLAAGQLHAYLDGLGIELMANSDNVLRCGLTPKHVDVPELLNVLDFNAYEVEFLSPEKIGACETLYSSPVEEFVLSTIVLKPGEIYKGKKHRSAEILLCMDGTATLSDIGTDHRISIKKGVSLIIPAVVAGYEMKGEAIFYKASVPSK